MAAGCVEYAGTVAMDRYSRAPGGIQNHRTGAKPDRATEGVASTCRRPVINLLSIVVHPERGYGNYPLPGPAGPIATFEVLAEHSMKWKELDIFCPDDCTQVLNVVKGRIPCLESFKINTSGMIIRDITLDFLADAPNLKSLDCTGLRLGGNGEPWPKLTSLNAYGDSSDVITVLRFAANVEYCRLAVHKKSHGSSEQQQLSPTNIISPIFLQNLKNLVIKHCTTMEFLSYIAAPSLQRLSVIQEAFPIDLEKLANFIERSHCKLRALGVAVAVPFDVESLRTLLSVSDSIIRLYIGSKKASDYKALMRQIPRMLDPELSAEEGNGSVLLPNLQILYYITVDPVRSEEMISMIKNRRKQNAQVAEKLKAVRFKKSNLKILLAPLKEEIEQGLEVTYDLPYKGEPFE